MCVEHALCNQPFEPIIVSGLIDPGIARLIQHEKFHIGLHPTFAERLDFNARANQASTRHRKFANRGSSTKSVTCFAPVELKCRIELYP